MSDTPRVDAEIHSPSGAPMEGWPRFARQLERKMIRFGRALLKERSTVDAKGCWIWAGAINSRGYGSFQVDDEMDAAHRVSFELFVGRIPDGFYVCHKCDVKRCINPKHLFLGTPADNLNDCYRKSRRPNKLANHMETVKEMLAQGNSITLIANVLGVSRSAIQWRLRREARAGGRA